MSRLKGAALRATHGLLMLSTKVLWHSLTSAHTVNPHIKDLADLATMIAATTITTVANPSYSKCNFVSEFTIVTC